MSRSRLVSEAIFERPSELLASGESLTLSEQGHFLTFFPQSQKDRNLRLKFATDGTKVTKIIIGQLPEVDYLEGCLDVVPGGTESKRLGEEEVTATQTKSACADWVRIILVPSHYLGMPLGRRSLPFSWQTSRFHLLPCCDRTYPIDYICDRLAWCEVF
ncbi:MAG: hypothetical protein RIM23_10525 [Coleofasciculus sp. G3-WIS-01]|uniref:hypothetical protein n=1 Tax=Coleofasciculus sp. G3-WIS-01 TaxID=3069528 RepID=UPI0033032544